MKETIQNGKHLLTLEELIDKKTELLFKKTIEVEIESLGGTLVFKQIPLSAIVRVIDDVFLFMVGLLWRSVKLLKC